MRPHHESAAAAERPETLAIAAQDQIAPQKNLFETFGQGNHANSADQALPEQPKQRKAVLCRIEQYDREAALFRHHPLVTPSDCLAHHGEIIRSILCADAEPAIALFVGVSA